MIQNTAKKIYIALIFIFLYAPIVTLMVLSFNASKTRAKWGGFTLQWYQNLFKNDAIMQALWNTLSIALLSALISTIIGTIACIAMQGMKRRNRTILMGICNIPMLNADIVTGISLMLLFISLGVHFGFLTILLAHITFNIPYVILSVAPKLTQLDNSMYEAALDLGAKPLYAFRKVVLPELMPGIINGLLIAFTLSIDDFVISFFTTGNGVSNLSIYVYSMAKRLNPKINALSTVMFLIVILLLAIINKRSSKDKSSSNILTEVEG